MSNKLVECILEDRITESYLVKGNTCNEFL